MMETFNTEENSMEPRDSYIMESWLKIGDHIETLDDREGFFGFKITIHDLAGNERIVSLQMMEPT